MTEGIVRKDWDSDFFGFEVYEIPSEVISPNDVEACLDHCRKKDARLVYYQRPEGEGEIQLNVKDVHTFLADHKTTLIKRSLKKKNPSLPVEAFDKVEAVSDLYPLAIETGVQSRFKVDPRIPNEKFEELYELWIKGSVEGRMADEVLVIKKDGDVTALVTLKVKEGCGDIGLIGVSKDFRGQGFATELLKASENWTVEKGFDCLTVVTQGKNETAMKLYLRNGFDVSDVKLFYHLWMDR